MHQAKIIKQNGNIMRLLSDTDKNSIDFLKIDPPACAELFDLWAKKIKRILKPKGILAVSFDHGYLLEMICVLSDYLEFLSIGKKDLIYYSNPTRRIKNINNDLIFTDFKNKESNIDEFVRNEQKMCKMSGGM